MTRHLIGPLVTCALGFLVIPLPTELVQLLVDVILTDGGAVVTQAARHTTKTIPIVGAVLGSNPVAFGFVASLARSGGNITGLDPPYCGVRRETAGAAQGRGARDHQRGRALESEQLRNVRGCSVAFSSSCSRTRVISADPGSSRERRGHTLRRIGHRERHSRRSRQSRLHRP